MTTFEILDIIADSYIPVLLLISLAIVVNSFKSRGIKIGFYHLCLLTALISLVYLFQFLDRAFSLWLYFGLDYSTHTAFALAIVAFVAFTTRKNTIHVIVSFLCYLLLMLYQHYHSLADIVVTIAAVSPFMFLSYYSTRHFIRS